MWTKREKKITKIWQQTFGPFYNYQHDVCRDVQKQKGQLMKALCYLKHIYMKNMHQKVK